MGLNFYIRNSIRRRVIASCAFFPFLFSTVVLPAQIGHAQETFSLPSPGVMILPTASYVPPMLKGMKVDLKDPFAFDFILDSGNANLDPAALKQESGRLIKYFLAALAIPETDLWVNLSPYEQDRIISSELGMTEMGRDLLSQDYILKQLTASLIYPEKDIGREFWSRVYAKTKQIYGTEDIPVDTFNKVWIVPDKAVVYQNNDTVYVLKSHLKVMLEEDYMALARSRGELTNFETSRGQFENKDKKTNAIGSQIVRDVILPEIEKEVNEGHNFLRLRQVYSSLILAKWYKQNLRQSILNREYSDQKKIAGVDVDDKNVKAKIYEQYLKAYKKGVFNYIKEDYDPGTQDTVPRKYFSGGLEMRVPLEVETNPAALAQAPAVGKLNRIDGVYRQPRVSARYEDFVKHPIAVFQNTSVIFENMRLAVKRFESVDVKIRASGVYAVGLMIKNRVIDQRIIREMKIIEKLMMVLNDEDSNVRAMAIQALGNGASLGAELSREIIETLFKALEDKDISASLAAVQALADNVMYWGESSPKIVLALVKILKEADSGVRAVIIQALGNGVMHWGESSGEIISILTKVLKEGNHDEHVAVAQALGQGARYWGKLSEEIIAVFGRDLADEYPDISAKAAQALADGVLQGGELSEKVILALLNVLEQKNDRARAAAMRGLGNCIANWGELSEKVILALVSVLKEKDSSGIVALQILGNSSMYWEKSAKENIQVLLSALKEKDIRINAAAAEALGNSAGYWGESAKEIIPALVKILEGEDVYAGAQAARALGKGAKYWGESAPGIISALMKAVETNYDVRQAAVQALENGVSQGGEVSEEIILDLVEVLERGEFWQVRAGAAKVLGNSGMFWGKLSGEIILALLRNMADRDDSVGVAVTEALGNSAGYWGESSGEIVRALLKTLKEENIRIGAAAAQSLGKGVRYWGELSQEIVQTLWDALEGGDIRINAAAVEALGNSIEDWGELSTKIIPVFMTVLGDKENNVGAIAAQALGNVVQQANREVLSVSQMLGYYSLLQREIKQSDKIVVDDDMSLKQVFVLRAHFFLTGEIKSEDVKDIGRLMEQTADQGYVRFMLDTMRLFDSGGLTQGGKYIRDRVERIISAGKTEGQFLQEIGARENYFLAIVIPYLDFSTKLKLLTSSQLPQEIRMGVLKNLTGREYGRYLNDHKITLAELLRSPDTILAILRQAQIIARESSDVIKFKDVDVLLQESMSGLSDKDKEFVLNEVIEPLFFANPQDLTISILNKLNIIFKGGDLFKYFLFYVSTRDKVLPEVKEKARQILSAYNVFQLHEQVSKRLKHGDVEVLVVQNIKDGQGDELVRVQTFVQALLDFNPDLKVTMVTGRPYLYDHPRVIVKSISEDMSQVFGKNYDVIVDHYDVKEVDSKQVEDQFRKAFAVGPKGALPKSTFMYIETNKSKDNFVFETVNIGGVNVAASLGLNMVKVTSVYDPVFRLLAELGIPFKVGEENSTQDSLVVGMPYSKAEYKWAQMMSLIDNFDSQRRKEINPVVVINPFGGESEGKGYSRKQNGFRELQEHMKILIANGFKILILPNGRLWGSETVAQELIAGMDKKDQKSIVIGPAPEEDPRYFKYFVSYADYLITVEGGMMHLGYILGKSMGIFLKSGAGPAKWIPRGITKNQKVISGNSLAEEEYRAIHERRNSLQQNPGGIDFNFDLLELEIQGQGSNFDFSGAGQDFEHIQINDGLMPVIKNITPVTNLPLILGSAVNEAQQLTSVR